MGDYDLEAKLPPTRLRATDWRQNFRNCISVSVEDGVWFPVRFTPKQLEFYANYSDKAHMRAVCSAGVQMEFTTAEKVVAFSCKTSHFVRQFCSFDIYENDIFTATFNFEGAPESVDISYTRKNAAASKITIHLPYTCRTGIRALEFAHEPTERGRLPKILACGDSITQNMTTEYSSIAYTTLMARHFGAELLNHGVGGFIFCKDSLDETLDYAPDLITVAYGTNDLRRFADVNEIARNAAEYTTRLKSIFPAARICLISPLWRDIFFETAEETARFHALSKSLETLCADMRIDFIDGMTLVPGMTEFFVDGTHPNARGFLSYALNLIRQIKPLQPHPAQNA